MPDRVVDPSPSPARGRDSPKAFRANAIGSFGSELGYREAIGDTPLLKSREIYSRVLRLIPRTKGRDLPSRLYVHIGTHKTGTTSIQSFLRSHSGQLAESGILVPASGTLHPSSGHHNISWELRNDRRFVKAASGVRELLDELRQSSRAAAIISCEDFEYLSQQPGKLKEFDDACRAIGFECTYIVFFRNLEDYTNSLYVELTGNGLVEDFHQFRAQISDRGYVIFNEDWYHEFDYRRFVATWESVVGPRLVCRDYDAAVAGEGLLPTFLSSIGASPELIAASRDAPVLNQSLDKLRRQTRELEIANELIVALQEQIELIRRSTSWRATAPLRRTARAVRALAGGRKAAGS